MKHLVTGGAGFIGSHLSRALLGAGHEVAVLDNLSTGDRARVPDAAEFIEGDLLNADDVARAVAGTDTVFHNAAIVSVRASVDRYLGDAEVNVIGTLNLLKAAAEAGVRKFVLASSMAIYGDSPMGTTVSEATPPDPASPYGTGKLACEFYCRQICAQAGMELVILRYFNCYGLHQTFTPYVGVVTIFINKLLAGEAPTIFGDGEQTRDFVSVNDIVQANLLALERGADGLVANVGSGKPCSVNEIARLLIDRIRPGTQPDHAPAHPGELRCSVADISRARDALGYEPKDTLEGEIGTLIDDIRAKRLARGEPVLD